MELSLIAGTASLELAQHVATDIAIDLTNRRVERFPDGELQVELVDSVRGRDVFIIQATSPPPDQHLVELLLLADACRRAGAGRTTAVIPYFGYARQDRRARGREAIAARLAADLIQASGIEQIVAVDVHTPAIEALTSIPVAHLSAVQSLIESARPLCGETSVIVAPDLGAAHLAERFADALGVPMAVVHKTRISGAEVRVSRVSGEVRGRSPVIVDDMISTGGTIEAAYRAVLDAGSSTELIVAATHGLFAGQAVERLRSLPVKHVIVTDSVKSPAETGLPVQVISLRQLLSEAIQRLHASRSLVGLIDYK
ncbi:MAG: ribose-phosphate pyrophosphokinase [Dehalococcoidia bacterium]